MSKSLLYLFTLGLAIGSPAARAENPYDVFAKALGPFVAMLSSETGEPGWSADLQLVQARGVDERYQNVRVSVALQMPDKLLLTAHTRDDNATLGRHGQIFWAAPAKPAEEILRELAPGILSYKGDIQAHVPEFKLPIPRNQLVFLPALFEVQDGGSEKIGGASCRKLDIRLTPAIDQQGIAGNWSARLWIDETYSLRRIEVRGRESAEVTVDVSSSTFTESAPAASWQPTPGEEVLELRPAQIEQLMNAVRGSLKID